MSQQRNNTEVPRKIVFHIVSQAFQEILQTKKHKTKDIFLQKSDHEVAPAFETSRHQ